MSSKIRGSIETQSRRIKLFMTHHDDDTHNRWRLSETALPWKRPSRQFSEAAKSAHKWELATSRWQRKRQRLFPRASGLDLPVQLEEDYAHL